MGQQHAWRLCVCIEQEGQVIRAQTCGRRGYQHTQGVLPDKAMQHFCAGLGKVAREIHAAVLWKCAGAGGAFFNALLYTRIERWPRLQTKRSKHATLAAFSFGIPPWPCVRPSI